MPETIRSYRESIEGITHMFSLTERIDFGAAVMRLAKEMNLSKAAIYRLGAKRLLAENGYEIDEKW